MNKRTFIFLNLFQIKTPFTALISFLHRFSGILIFLLIPLLLWTIGQVIQSQTGFLYIQSCFANPILRFLIWMFLAAFIYHLFAGLRHIVMDLGWGENLLTARVSGAIILAISIIFALLLGVWLW